MMFVNKLVVESLTMVVMVMMAMVTVVNVTDT